ncbi:hypothetical protein ACIGXM_05340 [Kitasatospora sp. NPDC052896]|uniref:hypothetical protein n=1 Tax=Kitasatospora sp. NPDC052896 TaxID=3364061 RepID=UPI0037C66EF6
MPRTNTGARSRLAVSAVVIAAALAVPGLGGTALAAAPASTAGTTTAPTGSLVLQEDGAFLQQSLSAGIVAIALPGATTGYSSSTGFSASFPVTGGSADVPGYYGNIQVGGNLLLVSARTGRTVVFTKLAFSVDNWAITGVPLGGTTPVNLLDPVGNTNIAVSGKTQTMQASDLEVDPQGAQYADAQLNTSFLVAGQHAGTASLTFTAGS